MKNLRRPSRSSRTKKVACTISAAALMLGVSSAATVGLHFQESYCDGGGNPSAGYSGFPVTLTAFGIPPSGWESLTMMGTGYSGCSGPLGYSLSEVVDSTTSTNGLNPLPNGSLSVNWFGPTANFSGFGGYIENPPYYIYGGTCPSKTGEEEIYATFIRDGINFGPPGGPDNDQPGYSVDITGLKSLFTNSPFVVELIASADSMETLTNAFVIDVPGQITNSVSYPNTPAVQDHGDAPWVRGQGGGLSTGSAALNTDHILIVSAHPQHVAGEFNHAGTISGFIVTDKPVISMQPQQALSVFGDTVLINPYTIGVPPLAYQWRRNGVPIFNATNATYTVANVSMGNAGNYDLVVSNPYGSATSPEVAVGDLINEASASDIVFDSTPTNVQHDGENMGATWEASSSDGTTTRTGVMSFVAADSNGISVVDAPNFDGPVGSVTFWMRSAGTVPNGSGSSGASLFCRPTGNTDNDFVLVQTDGSPGNLYFQSPNPTGGQFTSTVGVSDNKWHFVALTFDSTGNGGVGLYIDSSLDSTQSNGGTPWSWTTGQPLEIGYSTDSATWGDYTGLLDDVRYYSSILSPTEVSQIRASGAVVDLSDAQFQYDFTSAPGNGLVFTWKATGAVLQSASSVTGPWVDLPGAASPYLIIPGPTQQFFRYRYGHTPQSVVTNPYLM